MKLDDLDQNLRDTNERWDIVHCQVSSGRRFIGGFVTAIKKFFYKITFCLAKPILLKQVSYNSSNVRVLNEYRNFLSELSSQLDLQRQQIEQQHLLIEQQRMQIEQQRILIDDNANTSRRQREEEMIIISKQIEEMRQEIVAEKIEEGILKNEKMNIQYRQFENAMRGTRNEVKDRLTAYSGIVNQVKLNNGDKLFALDLGCGRGEWLELMRDYGIEAVGVDSDESMLDDCKKLELNTVNSDLLIYLKRVSSSSVDIATMFQVVEHLPMNVLLETLSELERVLRPGGVLILETPNPENLIVGACNFYFDPTHVSKLPPVLLQTFVQGSGFKNADILRLHEYGAITMTGSTDEKNPLSKGFEQMANFFNNYCDYAVVAYK